MSAVSASIRVLERIRYEGDICFIIPSEEILEKLGIKGGEKIRVRLLRVYDPKMRVVNEAGRVVEFESDAHHPHHWEIPMDVIRKHNIMDLGYIEFDVLEVVQH